MQTQLHLRFRTGAKEVRLLSTLAQTLLYLYGQYPNFELDCRFQRIKGATIKETNMLPIGSIFFPFRVAPMRIENNFKGH